QTVKEQLLYEIGNPKEYITPDCVADFTTIHLEQIGSNRVKVFGVGGKQATESYKVSMSYLDGFTAFSTLTYSWPDAYEKAKKADEILRQRLADLHLDLEEYRSEFLGYNSSHGGIANPPLEPSEVVLRVGVRGQNHESVERFGKEIAPLILTGPPSVTGFAGGRPKPSEVVSYWPSLIPKSAVHPSVVIKQL
ncbi:MAG TPA: acyclic terpene utilization AtuA family protein, partial [Bacteroidota bacterium]